jgi:flagellar biosynthesis protein FlhB
MENENHDIKIIKMEHLINGLEISRYKENKMYVIDYFYKFGKYFFILNIVFGIIWLNVYFNLHKTGEEGSKYMEFYTDFIHSIKDLDLSDKSLLSKFLSEILQVVLFIIFLITPLVLPTIILYLIFKLLVFIIHSIKPSFFSGNPSVHYFENCLYAQNASSKYEIILDGEIPYKVITKFLLIENKIQIIFKNSSDFDSESTYYKFLKEKENVLPKQFFLTPELKKHAIEIVQELNAKVMH